MKESMQKNDQGIREESTHEIYVGTKYESMEIKQESIGKKVRTKSSKGLAKKVKWKGNKELGRKVCNKSSKKLGKNMCKKLARN